MIELFLGVTGTQEGVAHFAHLGGMIGGYALLRYWRGPGCLRRVIPVTLDRRRSPRFTAADTPIPQSRHTTR